MYISPAHGKSYKMKQLSLFSKTFYKYFTTSIKTHPSTMKGILYSGPKQLEFSDKLPMPQLKHPDEVKIKVSFCGICGTDLLSYITETNFFKKIHPDSGHPFSGQKLPVIMGHEFSGTLVELGANVEKEGKFKVGDKVVCEPTIYCKDKVRWPDSTVGKASLKNGEYKQCSSCEDGMTNICQDMGITGLGCADGGLAEYVVSASHHLVKVPDFIPLDCAALVQPLSVSYHAFRTCSFKKGSSVLVVGCGSIGIGCILAAQAFEAGTIVCSEPAKVRREQAENLGIDAAFDPKSVDNDLDRIVEELKKYSPNGRGFDYAFDCSGFPITFDTGLRALRPRGTLVNLAIWPDKPMGEFYPMDFTSGEKNITGSMCYTIEDFQGVIDAMADERIPLENCRKLITKKVKLEDAVEGGFEELLHNKDKHVKILISPEI